MIIRGRYMIIRGRYMIIIGKYNNSIQIIISRSIGSIHVNSTLPPQPTLIPVTIYRYGHINVSTFHYPYQTHTSGGPI